MPDYKQRFTIKTWAEDDRPREKFSNKGSSALSDAELLAILIGSGNRNESAVDLSKKILQSLLNLVREEIFPMPWKGKALKAAKPFMIFFSHKLVI
jgi:DNA repair protein RadC